MPGAAAHRLDGRQSVAFVRRTGDKKICTGQKTLQLDNFHAPSELHGIADSRLLSQILKFCDAASFVGAGPDELDVGTSLPQFGHGVDQTIDSFIGSDPANPHQQAGRHLLFDVGIRLDRNAVTHQVQLVLGHDGGEHFVVVFTDAYDRGNAFQGVASNRAKVRRLEPGQPAGVKEGSMRAEDDGAAVEYFAEAQEVHKKIDRMNMQ